MNNANQATMMNAFSSSTPQLASTMDGYYEKTTISATWTYSDALKDPVLAAYALPPQQSVASFEDVDAASATSAPVPICSSRSSSLLSMDMKGPEMSVTEHTKLSVWSTLGSTELGFVDVLRRYDVSQSQQNAMCVYCGCCSADDDALSLISDLTDDEWSDDEDDDEWCDDETDDVSFGAEQSCSSIPAMVVVELDD